MLIKPQNLKNSQIPMYKIIAIYGVPKDIATFETHYREVHTPLTMKMPGIEKFVANRVLGSPQGKPSQYLIAEMIFKDKETMEKSMNSTEGRQSGKDAFQMATGGLTLLTVESKEA